MERIERIDPHSVTYTYTDTKLSKEEMLGYIVDILNDDDITANGIIMIAPADNSKDWAGVVTELPVVPDRETFVETYKDSALSGITAIFNYHDQQMMLSYRPVSGNLSIILPKEFKDTIRDVEENVIPAAIDGVPVIQKDKAQ